MATKDSKKDSSPATSRRRRIFDIIQIGQVNDLPSRAFDFFIILMILLNIAVLFMRTFESLNSYETLFVALEIFTSAVFIVEYILRIWTADFLYPDEGPVSSRIRFIKSFYGIVDLLTILPMFFLNGFVAFRMLRVVRILRLFRINAYYDSFAVIRDVIVKKKNQLTSSLFIIFILMMASSLCIYSTEHEAQPEAFGNAFSGLWWSIATLLTIGYGDIYPITAIGRLMGGITAILGVLTVAIPTGIISAGFVEEYTNVSNPFNDRSLKLEEIIVNLDSSWIGKKVSKIERDSDIRILLVYRDGRRSYAKASDIIRLNDVLVFERSDEIEDKL
ncbi:MAG: ion transporter [Treponema sp.]|nr:ion transporter [Treponema sp.]